MQNGTQDPRSQKTDLLLIYFLQYVSIFNFFHFLNIFCIAAFHIFEFTAHLFGVLRVVPCAYTFQYLSCLSEIRVIQQYRRN